MPVGCLRRLPRCLRFTRRLHCWTHFAVYACVRRRCHTAAHALPTFNLAGPIYTTPYLPFYSACGRFAAVWLRALLFWHCCPFVLLFLVPTYRCRSTTRTTPTHRLTAHAPLLYTLAFCPGHAATRHFCACSNTLPATDTTMPTLPTCLPVPRFAYRTPLQPVHAQLLHLYYVTAAQPAFTVDIATRLLVAGHCAGSACDLLTHFPPRAFAIHTRSADLRYPRSSPNTHALTATTTYATAYDAIPPACR